MATNNNGGRPDGKRGRWIVIVVVMAFLIWALTTLGCTVWYQAPFEIEVRNSSNSDLEFVQINGRDHDGPVEVGRSRVFTAWLLVRGYNQYQYSTGPSRVPECTEDIRVVGFDVSGRASKTLGISFLCQYQSGFVEFFPRDF